MELKDIDEDSIINFDFEQMDSSQNGENKINSNPSENFTIQKCKSFFFPGVSKMREQGSRRRSHQDRSKKNKKPLFRPGIKNVKKKKDEVRDPEPGDRLEKSPKQRAPAEYKKSGTSQQGRPNNIGRSKRRNTRKKRRRHGK